MTISHFCYVYICTRLEWLWIGHRLKSFLLNKLLPVENTLKLPACCKYYTLKKYCFFSPVRNDVKKQRFIIFLFENEYISLADCHQNFLDLKVLIVTKGFLVREPFIEKMNRFKVEATMNRLQDFWVLFFSNPIITYFKALCKICDSCFISLITDKTDKTVKTDEVLHQTRYNKESFLTFH